jgi:cytochrome P450
MPDTYADLPPGPRMPSALQSLIWFRQAQWMLDTCHARFGDMFTLKLVNEGTWVITSSPEVIKQIFTADPRLLHAGEANSTALPFFGPNSLLLLDDDDHMAQRKLLLPPFHGERMQSYGELMAEVARAEIERWPIGVPYRLRPRMYAMTLEVILHAVFGFADGPRLDRLRHDLHRMLDMSMNPWGGLVVLAIGPDRAARFSSFRHWVERVNRSIYEEIADRRQVAELAERQDIMSLLLQATHEDGSPMSDEELRDELVTLLVAGHGTAADSLAWAIERLCRHPEKLQRLTEEVRAGEHDYLEAVVQEILRLRPVVSVAPRQLVEPMELGGRLLPAGVSIVPAIYLVHRRGDIYPEPSEFRPERFVERLGGQAPGTYTWIPFGGGVRRCVGAAFAQFQMETMLRELVLLRTFAPTRPGSERVFRRAFAETPRHGAEVLVGTHPADEAGPSARQVEARAVPA